MGRKLQNGSETPGENRGGFQSTLERAKGEFIILRRLLRYSEKTLHLTQMLSGMRDRRKYPQHVSRVVLGSALIMALSRIGSLNGLEQTKAHSFWRRWIGGEIPSADTVARVFCLAECDCLRESLLILTKTIKRNKTLTAFTQGLHVLVLDGHESSSSEKRCCPGCLSRVLHTTAGDRTQYYHRNVTALLRAGNMALPLDEVRVVRSVEKRMIKRQRTKQEEEQVSDWMWVTTLSQSRATTQSIVRMGHGRWSIENEGFNSSGYTTPLFILPISLPPIFMESSQRNFREVLLLPEALHRLHFPPSPFSDFC